MKVKAYMYVDKKGCRRIYDNWLDAEIEYCAFVGSNPRDVKSVYRIYDVELKDGKSLLCRISRSGNYIVPLGSDFDMYHKSEVKSFKDITLAYYLQGGDILYV
jgi:hypothetical protein